MKDVLCTLLFSLRDYTRVCRVGRVCAPPEVSAGCAPACPAGNVPGSERQRRDVGRCNCIFAVMRISRTPPATSDQAGEAPQGVVRSVNIDTNRGKEEGEKVFVSVVEDDGEMEFA